MWDFQHKQSSIKHNICVLDNVKCKVSYLVHQMQVVWLDKCMSCLIYSSTDKHKCCAHVLSDKFLLEQKQISILSHIILFLNKG